MKFRAALIAAALALPCLLSHATPSPHQTPLQSCHLPGHEEPLRCALIPVPLDYADPARGTLSLHVAVAPAFRSPAQPDPLFVLAGGPGQAGSDIAPLLDSAFRKARATRDIVLIDQRGTGLSGKLDCDNTRTMDEHPDTEQEQIVADCIHSLKRPFALYNTENSARDLDRVRQALGYPAVDLWGASYGTRLAQAYARLFPARTRALVLDGVASPEQIVFVWGKDAQASLDKLFAQCEQDRDCHTAFPALRKDFAELTTRVNAGRVTLDFAHPRTAQPTHLVLQPAMFLQTVRAALYATPMRAHLPYLIGSATRGDWMPFLAQMAALSDSALAPPALGLMLSVTCAEDLPRLTPAIAADEEKDSFLAGWEVKTMPRWCRFVDVPAIPYRVPEKINAPALLLSGALDPVTPPYRAAQAASHMSHAQQFTVKNAGHVVSTLGCTPKLLRAFLDHPDKPLDAKCLNEIPPAAFQLDAAGPHP